MIVRPSILSPTQRQTELVYKAKEHFRNTTDAQLARSFRTLFGATFATSGLIALRAAHPIGWAVGAVHLSMGLLVMLSGGNTNEAKTHLDKLNSFANENKELIAGRAA